MLALSLPLAVHALLLPHGAAPARIARCARVLCVADPMPQPDTTELYATMDRLLRKAERSPRVRTLKQQWLTMPPEEVLAPARGAVWGYP